MKPPLAQDVAPPEIGPVLASSDRARLRVSGAGLRLQILGPLRLWRDEVELNPGSPQQARLLALLLARVGRPTSTAELIELIWGESVPDSACNVIHKYVGMVRRLLEPALPARACGSYLLRRGEGYLCAAGPGTLDLVTFRELVSTAKVALDAGRPDASLDQYAQALALWHGPAGSGMDSGPATSGVFTALNTELFDTCTAAGTLAVSLGRPDRILPAVQLAATIDPWHEALQATLISALSAAGRQADALAVHRNACLRLRQDLGISPGEALQTAYTAALNQTSTPTERPPVLGCVSTCGQPWSSAESERVPAAGVVGRDAELEQLRRAIEPSFSGAKGLAVVVGEPGVGKTRLLEELSAEAGQRGVFVAWGRCLDGDGAPSMWPWVQVVATVSRHLPAQVRDSWMTGELGKLLGSADEVPSESVLGDGNAQFRLFEQVVAAVTEVAKRRPLMLVIDDLQWADDASLRLFSHLAARLPDGTAIVSALRDRAPGVGSELSRVLALACRQPGYRRLQLGPLDQEATAELVLQVTGQFPTIGVAEIIHSRTDGNPFFIRELTRVLAVGGGLTRDSVTRAGVPATVRDIVADRMAVLDGPTRLLLQIAALVGRNIDLGLLAGVADIDVPTCLARLDPLEALGLFGPAPGDPFTFRFPHDLVREAVIEGTPLRVATPLHLRVADALEQTDPDDESVWERVASHLWAAGPLADAGRTAAALLRAGRRAATICAFEAADRRLRTAVEVARTAGLADLELAALSELTALFAMCTGWVGSNVDVLERAEQLARSLGREREASGFLLSLWTAQAESIELERGGPIAARLLEHGHASCDPVVRAYGLHAWGIHQWSLGNIGEAFRHLSRSHQIMLADDSPHEQDWLRHDQQVRSPVMLAEMTAVHGDLEAAKALLDTVEAAAGQDPYAITVWATFAARIAPMAGDPAWALHAARRGSAVDPDFSFAYLGIHQRLARCWALAVTGHDPAAAAQEAEGLIAANLFDPPRSSATTSLGLLGEMRLAAGELDKAAAALDRADFLLETYGLRYSEGLLLLMRARLLQAQGEPVSVVRAAAERAWSLSAEREAHLFAQRATCFLAQLDG
jgi:DNA-binding SARP family transcriptional activator/tetratricopeptide (TPR) repeat protein